MAHLEPLDFTAYYSAMSFLGNLANHKGSAEIQVQDKGSISHLQGQKNIVVQEKN